MFIEIEASEPKNFRGLALVFTFPEARLKTWVIVEYDENGKIDPNLLAAKLAIVSMSLNDYHESEESHGNANR